MLHVRFSNFKVGPFFRNFNLAHLPAETGLILEKIETACLDVYCPSASSMNANGAEIKHIVTNSGTKKNTETVVDQVDENVEKSLVNSMY